MDSWLEKFAVVPQSQKSEEEIQKLVAPENDSPIQRAKYLIINGQNFQKIFIAQHLEEYLSDLNGTSEICLLIGKQFQREEQVTLELIHGVAKVFGKIPLTDQLITIYSDICFQVFTKQQSNLIDDCAQILKQLDELDTYKEGLYLETDNQMQQILKIIEIYYEKFDSNLKIQAHKQLKSSIKHKDERIRKMVPEILIKNSILLNAIMKDFDWIDKFTNLIYDQNKDVRWQATKLFLNTFELYEDIHKSRTILLLENIIQQMDDSQFILCDQITKYCQQESLQQLFIERIRQLINIKDSCYLFIEHIHIFYKEIKKFIDKYSNIIDELLIITIQKLQNDFRNFDILKHCKQLYPFLQPEIHLRIMNGLFINFDPYQLQFIPYLENIIDQSIQLNKNPIWLQQLQTIYDLFKRSIFQYETKGLWFEIENLIIILQKISTILFQQKDFLQLCLKMITIGSDRIRKKILKLLIQQLIELDTNEAREQIIQSYLSLIQHSNYQFRQLAIQFCIIIAKERSRKFYLQYNLTNILQLHLDPVSLVRAKIPQLIYEIKLLFWNDEKPLLNKMQQILTVLKTDKKLFIQDITNKIQEQISSIDFGDAETIIQMNQIVNLKEKQENNNLKIIMKPQQNLVPKRNQTPTARLPPSSRRPGNILLIPKPVQARKSSSRMFQSKSPQPFK